jgi:hypothetical protein
MSGKIKRPYNNWTPDMSGWSNGLSAQMAQICPDRQTASWGIIRGPTLTHSTRAEWETAEFQTLGYPLVLHIVYNMLQTSGAPHLVFLTCGSSMNQAEGSIIYQIIVDCACFAIQPEKS